MFRSLQGVNGLLEFSHYLLLLPQRGLRWDADMAFQGVCGLR